MQPRIPFHSRTSHGAPSLLPSREGASTIPVSADRFAQALTEMDTGNLVLRGGGLSVFHSCQPKFLTESDWTPHPEREEGLRVRADFVERIWLINLESEPARFEVEMKQGMGSFSFYPANDARTLSVLDSLRLEAIALSRLHSLKPPPERAEWLDQRLSSFNEPWCIRLNLETLHDEAKATISMASSGLEFDCSFTVASFDTISEVVRLASSRARTAVHFTSNEMQLTPTSQGLELTHGEASRDQYSTLLDDWAAPLLYR